ncbi:MAG: NAD(P)H-dependent glycerol-3-phosphate dehydrogenase, partial [Pseudomonadota bacterium]
MHRSLTIIGHGAFGRALEAIYTQNGFQTRLFGRDAPRRLEGEVVFLAVPSDAVPQVLQDRTVSTDSVIILCCKGILGDGRLPSAHMPAGVGWAVLSGPGFAFELQQQLPTIHALASTTLPVQDLAAQLSLPSFRLYWSDDPIGTQVCGAFKNVLAIAAGIADGLALGENARAALITRGAHEMRRAVLAFGGVERTIWSPAGLGDLVLTCSSAQSRNFRFGQ